MFLLSPRGVFLGAMFVFGVIQCPYNALMIGRLLSFLGCHHNEHLPKQTKKLPIGGGFKYIFIFSPISGIFPF